MRYLVKCRPLQKGKHQVVNIDENVIALGKITTNHNETSHFFKETTLLLL